MKNKVHKNFIILSILLSLVILILKLTLTYFIDPANVYNKNNLFIKYELLFHRTQKFNELQIVKPNTLLIGGSRVLFFDAKEVSKYTKDKVYNLGFEESTLEEQYYFIRYSIDKFDIKNVIMGLNLYPFSENLKLNPSSDFDKNIFIDGFTFYRQFKYLLEIETIRYFKNLFKKGYKKPLLKNGGYTPYYQSFAEELSWDKRNSVEGYFDTYGKYLIDGDSGFEYLRKIVRLCKENNIELKLFTTATHVSVLQVLEDLDKMDIYYNWKIKLASIAPYWDFMYLNSVTEDNTKFIDPSHLLMINTQLYLAKIFNDKNISSQKDFGVYVTIDNINEHILNIRYTWRKYLKDVL